MGIIRRQGIKNSIAIYAGIGIGFVNKVFLLTKFLSPEEVGLINFMQNFSVLFASVCAMGVPHVIQKFFPHFESREKKHHGILFWGLVTTSAMFIVVAGLYILLKPWIGAKFLKDNGLLEDFYLYVIPLALFTVWFNVIEAYLKSLLKTVVPVVLRETFMRAVMTVIILVYVLDIIDFRQLVLLMVISMFLALAIILVYMIYLRQFFVTADNSRELKRYLKEMIPFGLFVFFTSASSFLLVNLDSMMLVPLKELGIIGIYTTAAYISVLVWVPYRAMLAVYFPVVAGLFKERKMDEIEANYKKFSSINLVAGTLLLMGIYISFDDLFGLINPVYQQGKTAFLLLSLGKLADMTAGLNGYILLNSDKYRADLYFSIFLILLTIGSNYVFIYVLGMRMDGAALATLITMVVMNIIRIWYIKYHFNMQPFRLKMLYIFPAAAAAYAAAWALPEISSPVLSILLKSLVLVAVYLPLVYFLKISEEANKMIRGILAKFQK